MLGCASYPAYGPDRPKHHLRGLVVQEIAGVPWRNWIPDFKLPTVCQVEGCGGKVTRAVWWTAPLRNGEEEILIFTQYSFMCGEHADFFEQAVNER